MPYFQMILCWDIFLHYYENVFKASLPYPNKIIKRFFEVLKKGLLNNFDASKIDQKNFWTYSFFVTSRLKTKDLMYQWSPIKYPAKIYLFKVNNRNTRKKSEICSKLTIKTSERRVFIVNFEHISYLFLVFLLLTLNK